LIVIVGQLLMETKMPLTRRMNSIRMINQ